jgi:hypothetical protein
VLEIQEESDTSDAAQIVNTENKRVSIPSIKVARGRHDGGGSILRTIV